MSGLLPMVVLIFAVIAIVVIADRRFGLIDALKNGKQPQKPETIEGLKEEIEKEKLRKELRELKKDKQQW